MFSGCYRGSVCCSHVVEASCVHKLELTMPFCRAIVVEVCRRANAVESSQSTEKWQRQLAALEALQIFAPMGHALGLSRICAELEDRCFQVMSVGSADC